MPAVACVVLLGTLGACGSGTPVTEPSGDVTATAEPTPTVTPTPSPEPSPTADAAPPRPAAMDRTDGEGAAAAAQYFLSLYPYIMRTGDTTEWDAMSGGSTCSFCLTNSDAAAGVASRGETVEGGDITTRVVQIYDRDTLVGGIPVAVSMHQNEMTGFAGETVAWAQAAYDGVVTLDLLHDGTMWRVLAVTAGE